MPGNNRREPQSIIAAGTPDVETYGRGFLLRRRGSCLEAIPPIRSTADVAGPPAADRQSESDADDRRQLWLSQDLDSAEQCFAFVGLKRHPQLAITADILEFAYEDITRTLGQLGHIQAFQYGLALQADIKDPLAGLQLLGFREVEPHRVLAHRLGGGGCHDDGLQAFTARSGDPLQPGSFDL